MIKLTRLEGEPFILNADLLKYIEARPDTFITLTTDERLVVKESIDEVMRRAIVYQQIKNVVPRAGSPNDAVRYGNYSSRKLLTRRKNGLWTSPVSSDSESDWFY